MSILRSNKNKTTSHKLKRSLAFRSWRRNISGKEKWVATQPKKITQSFENDQDRWEKIYQKGAKTAKEFIITSEEDIERITS